MITTTATGQLTIYISDDPIDDAAVASLMDRLSLDDKPIIIDARRAQSCMEVEEAICRLAAACTQTRNIVVVDLLEAFYDSAILTREAAQILGRVKGKLESLVEIGAQVIVLCHRRAADLGTRAHFIASLCASADQVQFRRST